MEFLYYPGCSLGVSASNYNISAIKVCEELGITLKEINDWNCCGATSFIALDELMGTVVSARNLAIAEKQGFKELVVTCSGCYVTLKKANTHMKERPKFKEQVNEALGAANMTYSGNVEIRHLIEVLALDCGLEKITKSIKKPLKNLKIAAYSGCQLVRPYCTFDNKEFPHVLDDLLKTTGATVVDFEFKARCCGGMLMQTNKEIAEKMVLDILEDATRHNADCIATACPLCQMNLEGFQGSINTHFHKEYKIPIMPFTQIMGLALGLKEGDLKIKRNLISPELALAK